MIKLYKTGKHFVLKKRINKNKYIVMKTKPAYKKSKKLIQWDFIIPSAVNLTKPISQNIPQIMSVSNS